MTRLLELLAAVSLWPLLEYAIARRRGRRS